MLIRMRERVHKRMDEEGFTLIELLIVVIILAVLAAIVIFAVGDFTTRSKKAACRTDFKTVETGLEARKADEGGPYAGTISALVPKYIRESPVTGTAANSTNPYVFSNTINTTTGAITVFVWTGTSESGTSSAKCNDIT